MSVFCDTSALYAVLDRDDAGHPGAASAWRRLLEEGSGLLTHNYVVVEVTALVQRRLGMGAVAALEDGLLPLIEIRYVTPELHREAMTALRAADRGDLSLVDWVSFLLMRRLELTQALAVDRDFADQGFELVE